jgi:hypothetical protein
MAVINGTDGADALTGGPEGDILVGNGGGDTLVASGSNFTFAAYWTSPGPVRVELFREAVFDGFGDPGSQDALRGIHGVFGSAFGDGMIGSALTDVLVGLDGNDTIIGLDGDDVLNGGGGDDQIDGGAGNDTAVHNGLRSNYTIAAVEGGFAIADARAGGDGADTVSGVEVFQFDDGILTAANLLTGKPTPAGGGGRLVPGSGDETITGGSGRDWLDFTTQGHRGDAVQVQQDGGVQLAHGGQVRTLYGVEEVRFADGRLVFDAADPAAQVVRLYEAALDRLPDQGGLNFWIGAVQNGQPLSSLASGFLASAEFQARFGGAGSSNGAFVDQLYLNVLGRAGEAEGRQFWAGSLDRGTSRADVLAAFSESAENRAGTAALVQQGVWDRSEAAAEVARLYDTVFGRLPDAPGLVAWKNALEGGQASLVQVADAFTGSAEFKAQYGSLANRDFANALYVNTLDRPADQAGLDHWTGVLNSGVSRAEVVLAFSESAEHVALTAANIQSEAPGQYGLLFA